MKTINIFVISSRFGIHIFPDDGTLNWQILKISHRFAERDNRNYKASKLLFQQLSRCSFDRKWVKTVKEPTFYRRVGKTRDVLDTAGSLSDGGRFNLGGAQSSSSTAKSFHPLGNKRSALYLGTDPSVVRKEYGDYDAVRSTAITYSIQLKRKQILRLVDFTAALKGLSTSIPYIKELIGAKSMNGNWGDLKQPAPSQILGHWLITNAPKDTIGIEFPSTHAATSQNTCLFFNDTAACKNLLKATRLP